MCGIAGILSLNDSYVPFHNIISMTEAMRHRGPDDAGYAFFHRVEPRVWQFGCQDTPQSVYAAELPYTPAGSFSSQLPSEEVGIVLGHRRLSILDLSSAGHQPMCTEDQRYWLIHNGEVYNFQEIRQELEVAGDFFYSHTDTEVILKAYRRWGPDCLTRFNGMWAFAIWDNHDKVLFCARDRIGIKPFYYYLTDDLFLFASDIKTLIASGLYLPEPDWEGVYHAMSFDCAPRPMTSFKGIKALEQSHWMTIDLQGRLKKQRYWQMPVGELDYSKTEAQWVEELEQALNLAVQRRLVADVPVGVLMSGGIDSTTVTAIAAQQHPGIKAFTLTYEDEAQELPELSQAKATAHMYPLEHLIKLVRPEEMLHYLDEMVRGHEEPRCSLSPNYVISQFVAANKVKVVLNGLGGDELFGGYRRERLLKRWQRLRPWRGLLALMPQLHPKLIRAKEFSALRDIHEYYVYIFSQFSEYDKQAFFPALAQQQWNSYTQFKVTYGLEALQFGDPIEALCYCDMINYIGNHHVYRVDQFTMNFSLEGRFPMLDHELVELACRMPAQLKVNNGVGKHVLREVARGLIHPSSLAMKKKGFSLPIGLWMRSNLKSLVSDKIAALNNRGILDLNRLEHRLEQGRIRDRQLWFLVSLELWLEEFFDNNHPVANTKTSERS